MFGKFHTPQQMVRVGVSICPKMTVFGQKQAKWGQSKQLWHPNLLTFFGEVIIFELVGDEVKMLPPYSLRPQGKKVNKHSVWLR